MPVGRREVQPLDLSARGAAKQVEVHFHRAEGKDVLGVDRVERERLDAAADRLRR